jgi:hypothetical protein
MFPGKLALSEVEVLTDCHLYINKTFAFKTIRLNPFFISSDGISKPEARPVMKAAL